MSKKGKKYVYFYGLSGKKNLTEGDAKMKALLGGKGANLAEMANVGVPVPPGFTISTEACADYNALGLKFPKGMWEETLANLGKLEKVLDKKLGDATNPLLVSVRSGAAASMPASFHKARSFLWVPDSSPREAKGALASAILCSAAGASFMPETPAGSALGPTMTKSLYMTSKRFTPQPSATNFSSACLA